MGPRTLSLSGEGALRMTKEGARSLSEGAPAWATLTDGLPNPALGYGVGMLGDPAQQRAFDNFWANKSGPGGVGITDRFATMLARYGRAFRGQRYLLGYGRLDRGFGLGRHGFRPLGVQRLNLRGRLNELVDGVRVK